MEEKQSSGLYDEFFGDWRCSKTAKTSSQFGMVTSVLLLIGGIIILFIYLFLDPTFNNTGVMIYRNIGFIFLIIGFPLIVVVLIVLSKCNKKQQSE